MKLLFITFLTLLIPTVFAGELYKIKLKTSKGKDLSLKDYKGKTLVIVNIATKCGYTPQLDDLEKLYAQYKQKDVVVLGIPSNDFGGQTPEASAEAAKFCRLKYGVSFPLTKKYVVSGKERHELFKMIQKQKGEDFDVNWNFEKFVFNKKGELVGSFRSSTAPLSKELTSTIDKTL